MTVWILLTIATSAQAGGTLEGQMNAALLNSARILEHIDQHGASQADFNRLQSLKTQIRAMHLLLEDKFARIGRRTDATGAAPAERHRVMQSAYHDTVAAYLESLETITSAQDLGPATIQHLLQILVPARQTHKLPLFGSLTYTHLNWAAKKPYRDTTGG